jgi:serine protease Do
MNLIKRSSLWRGTRASVYGLSLALAIGVGMTSASVVSGEEKAPVEKRLATPAELSRTFVDVAKQVKPAVVNIDVVEKPKQSTRYQRNNQSEIPGFPFGQMPQRQQPRRGTGSGVIISADGFILTNNHVAGDADEINVKLADGRTLKARRIGGDPETDIALIKVDVTNLPFAKLGDSSQLEQGEWVIALGSPFGLEQTMTAGIVSATSRDLRNGPYDNYIQTDASINPGNSGGPLVNMNGEVIGINTMIYSRSGGSEGIGFAVPSNMASKVYTHLAKSGRVMRGYLGVNLQSVTPALAQNFNYEGAEGAIVGDVADASSPAAKAGLQSGDVITEFDGQRVKSPKQLTEFVADTEVGKSVTVKYVRDGRFGTATIKLGERPGRKSEAGEVENAPAAQNTGKLGVSIATVTPEIARELKLRINTGVLIENVVPESPAAEAGLQRGDVIHRVNRMQVASVDALGAAMKSLSGSKEIVLQIEREGQLTFITVTLG